MSGLLHRSLTVPSAPRCSLVGICLPDELRVLGEDMGGGPNEVRRLIPPAPDARPLYVQEHGARVGKSGDTLVIRQRGGDSASVRLLDVSQLCLMGNAQVTSQALQALLRRGVPVAHFSYGGQFLGLTTGLGSRAVSLRVAQVRCADDEQRSLEFACGFVRRKILNCRTVLRRNHAEPPRRSLGELRKLAQRAGGRAIAGLAPRCRGPGCQGLLRPLRRATQEGHGRRESLFVPASQS